MHTKESEHCQSRAAYREREDPNGTSDGLCGEGRPGALFELPQLREVVSQQESRLGDFFNPVLHGANFTHF